MVCTAGAEFPGISSGNVDIEGNRELAMLRIGDVVVLNWEPLWGQEHDPSTTNVNLGEYKEGKVTISAVEDVFVGKKRTLTFPAARNGNPRINIPRASRIFAILSFPMKL